MKTKEKRRQMKCESISKATYAESWKCMLQSLLELHGMPNLKSTCMHESWNDSHDLAHSFWAWKFTCFSKFTFIIACNFGSTCIWRNFFFPSVWLHNNFILRQNKIFCVNDVETWPRLNTVKESANLRKPQTKNVRKDFLWQIQSRITTAVGFIKELFNSNMWIL